MERPKNFSGWWNQCKNIGIPPLPKTMSIGCIVSSFSILLTWIIFTISLRNDCLDCKIDLGEEKDRTENLVDELRISDEQKDRAIYDLSIIDKGKYSEIGIEIVLSLMTDFERKELLDCVKKCSSGS